MWMNRVTMTNNPDNAPLVAWEHVQSKMCCTFQDRFVWACARYPGLARFLLKLPSVSINGRNWESHTALTACLQRDHMLRICSRDEIFWLLANGADLEAFFGGSVPGDRQMTPLMFASAYYKPYVVKLLLVNGARVDARNCHNETAVHYCASSFPRAVDRWSHESAVAVILESLDEAGADLDAHDCGFSPLVSALDSWNQYVAVYLLCLNCDPSGGFDPQSPETSESANISPLAVAVKKISKKRDLIGVLLMAGCRLQGIANCGVYRQPQWRKMKLTSPPRLQDLCMARIRTSLRHGPFGAAGGAGGLGLGGFRRLELGVQGLPVPLCLKRRILMVGLRKLLREGEATFAKRRMKFCLDSSNFLTCTPIEYIPGTVDADDDTYYDEVLA